ncbi:unnamed protein product [Effrenium voratum]|nr:unnamed protein product [Effrenium voratum]
MGVLGLSDDAFLPEHMFRVFDSNEDGMLSFHEFATALATMIRGTEDEKLRLSFNMAAGKCQAEHLSLQDFLQLVRACKGLTSSLVALSNDTSEKDVERLFFELVGTSDVMTFETYKAAAQHEGFLMSLGLARGRAVRTRVATGVAEREAAMASNGFAWAQTVSPVSSQSRQDAFVALADITEMHSRLNRVDELLHKKAAQTADFSEDTHVVNFADASPLRRPASPQANLVSLGVADAWQDLARFVEEWDALRGKIGGLQGSSGLLGVREASLPLDDEEMESKVTSRAMSRMSSKHSAETGITGDVWRRQQTMQASHRKQRRRRLLAPKKGLAVHFGHESWNMVLSMMVGIRMSVARCKHEIHRELQPVDYIMQEKFTITPRLMPYRDERKTTRFVDFAPMVFQEIRSRFGISEEEYLRSVGPEQLLGNLVLGNLSSLSELSSEGKSGAFFYYTADGKYMMKTVTPKEFVLLRKMLKGYSDHIKENPGTLVVRFLGLHCLRAQKSRRPKKNLYFVVMANMFNTPCEIHRRYDLKGSWVGRVTLPENRNSHIALKDVDFQQANEKIIVGKERKSLLAQIRRDSEFLASNNIIDYSLLLGIHDKDSALAVQAKGEVLGFVSEDSRTIYFMGIIDILTPFDKMKKLEHTLKALRHDWHGVSCCPPSFYASRFCNFMERAFG